MKQPSLKKLQEQVDKFNGTFGVGAKVDIRMDDNSIKSVTVAHPASVLGGHSAVGWFEEISGCYSLGRVCDGAYTALLKK